MVEVIQANRKAPIELTVKYFACSDEWCKPVTQKYRVHLERDRDAGVVRTEIVPQIAALASVAGPAVVSILLAER